MSDATTSITLLIALLALFLITITILKYAVENKFTRTRLIMSALFIFIVVTLTLSFRQYVDATLPYTIPALIVGMALGYFIGVRTERQKLMTLGLEHYMEHFAHIHSEDIKRMTWWSVVNFYSVMSALILINLVGLTSVILEGSRIATIATSVVGALLIGSIVPYLAHLWSVPATASANR